MRYDTTHNIIYIVCLGGFVKKNKAKKPFCKGFFSIKLFYLRKCIFLVDKVEVKDVLY